jgi:putative sigma-54 modulation protein
MKIEFTGRHIDITPAIRDFTEDKLRKLERWIDEILETHVVLSVEKHRHIAEIVLRARAHTFTGTDATGDMYASIGNAADKIEKQARRVKDKVTGRRKHARPPARAPRGAMGGREDRDGDGAGQRESRIIRVPVDTKKPMSVEDAALVLSETDQEFLVFREARSQRISVLYRRRDGHLGLIEPDR